MPATSPPAGAAMGGWLDWLGNSPVGQSMRNELWLYPAVEVVHIIGFAVLVGAVAMFDLRILGWARDIPVMALAHHLLRWAVASLLLIVPAGLLMFSAHPHDFVSNGVFILKLCLIGVAGINAALFHLGPYRSVSDWNTDVAAPATARLQATLSLVLWIAVVLCGRLLAYT